MNIFPEYGATGNCVLGEMLMIVYPRESDRACRDFRVKFPDEIIHDSLPGQLWFGAEVRLL